ncbi:MAG: LD-carboxypeptidase, partial [Candidatus Berkiella sp.]
HYLHEQQDKIKKVTPKWMIGFSDTTALLVYFENVYGWPVVHGASPKQFFAKDVDQKTELTTMNLLFGKPSTDIIQLSPLNDFARKESMIEATLTGGNLSLIDISIKDLWEIQTKNKIIFFED